MRFLMTVLLCLATAGCTQMAYTNVDAYSSIPADLDPKTIYIAPHSAETGNNSLEWQTNVQFLSRALSEKGFSVVGRKRDARLTAHFSFAVDQGERVQTSYSIPEWGVTGYDSASTYGTVYGNTYSANTTLHPTYGVAGYSTGTVTSIVYTRSVSIEMIDNRTRQRVFQAKGVSRGACHSFTPVALPIFRAILFKFPQGTTEFIQSPVEHEC